MIADHRRKPFKIEVVVLVVYAIALAVIMNFHEPWFDEAQAWLIARDATIREIISSITHYEGHSPVWFLILLPLAKLNVPFEIGIKSVNFVFAVTAMGLFLFKAPFKRPIRFALPFTYFFFYQYGVTSRPYSLMTLGFILAAMFYKDRNTRPIRFTAALALICASSAYGMVIAAGIAAVWLFEVVREKTGNNLLVHKDPRLWSLFALLGFNILLMLSMIPFPDTFGSNLKQNNTFFERLFYMIFIAPGDATASISFFDSNIKVKLDIQSAGALAIGMVVTLTVLIMTRIHKKRLLFLVPFFLFALFGSAIYFSAHHVGILFVFYVFIMWCCYAESSTPVENPYLKKLATNAKDLKTIKSLYPIFLTLIILVSIYHSAYASINEIIYNYGTGREAADFLVDHNLDDLDIMTTWLTNEDPDSGTKIHDFNFVQGVPLLAYFDRNILYNFNGGNDNQCYMLHKIQNSDESTRELAKQGYPDILFGYVDLELIFGSEISISDYALVESVHGHTIWKDRIAQYRQLIFIRRDLLGLYPDLVELNILDEILFIPD